MPPRKRLNEKFQKFNEERKAKGLPVIPFEEWFKKHYQKRDNVNRIIKYLDLGLESLNVGTKNKQRLMERALAYMKKWQKGSYKDFIHRLSIRLNVSPRTVRENYLDPLISEGIIERIDSEVVFVGLLNEKGENGDA